MRTIVVFLLATAGPLLLAESAHAQCPSPVNGSGAAAHNAQLFGSGNPNRLILNAVTVNDDNESTRSWCNSKVQTEGVIMGVSGAPPTAITQAPVEATIPTQIHNFAEKSFGTFSALTKHWYIWDKCTSYGFFVVYFCLPGSELPTVWHLESEKNPETTIREAEVDVDDDGYSEDEGDCGPQENDLYPGAPNPECGYMLTPGKDYDCNGVADEDEYFTVCPNSPIVIDMVGDGFALTDGHAGVRFDLDGDGVPEQIPWTHGDSDEAWLALDRNLNWRIDDGRELFGNFTPQPAAPNANGFRALAVFDRLAEGGNNDGWIDATDQIFDRLVLWTDRNHDGVSQPEELQPLKSSSITRVSLHYQESRRVDRWGNLFRYRAKVIGGVGAPNLRWATDVYFPPMQVSR